MRPDHPARPGDTLEQATRLIESERAQIGHEIHDALLPLIFAASAAVSNLAEQSQAGSQGDSLPKLQRIAGWLDDAMQTGRRLLTEVYPPELTGARWTDAAADTVDRLLGETTTRVQWTVDPQVNDVTLPVAMAAYRIVVEATRNAARHGKAAEVVIDGNKSPSGLRISILDDGCGFDPSALPKDRFGIRSMTARARLVDGSLEVKSSPGGPTTVTFTAHVDTAQASDDA